MSMQYTSAAVLRLIDRHKLTLETTIGNLLPNTPGAEKIMLRDLLLQQSGLDDINSHSDYGEILQHHQTPASLVAQIDGHSLSFASGSKHARSLLCYHARLVKVKNVSADVSERQALSSLIRCSSSREPIMKYEWLVPGAHVSSVGGTFGPELDAQTIGAGMLFVESRETALQPPIAGAHELQGLTAESVTEIGEVIAGTRPGRTAPEQLTVYKSTGHAVEDAAAVKIVYERALAEGVGQRVTL